MNTKQTQNNSVTQWELNITNHGYMVCEKDNILFFEEPNTYKLPSKEVASHIVHCVNSHEQMSEDLARTVKQKDELLESLKDIISLFNSCDDSVCEMFDLTQKGLDLHLDDARKCISQIESEGVN